MFEIKAVIITIILVSGYVITYGSVLRTSPARNSINEEYNPYTDLMNNRDRHNSNYDSNDDDSDNNNHHNSDMDVFAQIEKFYLNKLQNRKHLQNIPRPKPSKVERTAYLLVKTMRQRDKRYVSYLTLCHFKICNMGRKRTTRYFHMIRTLNDDAGA